jgi:hypothetical protein
LANPLEEGVHLVVREIRERPAAMQQAQVNDEVFNDDY